MFLRGTFRLSQRGDARSDYYSPAPYSKLKVEIFSSSFGTLFPSSVDLITNGLGNVLNKPSGITIEEKTLDTDPPSEIDDSYLQSLANGPIDYTTDTVVMRVYILSSYKNQPTILGQTAGAYSFAVFKSSIENSSNSAPAQEDLEKEVILHEIGHLLGAEHLVGEDCVMNTFVDVTNPGSFTYTPTEYCPADLTAIREANY